jgi:hypothetical protein
MDFFGALLNGLFGGGGGGTYAVRPSNNIFDFISLVTYTIDHFIVPLLFAIAFIVFLWGIYTYFIAGAGQEEKRETGRKFALYGLIGFVVMIAIWGLVNLITNSLGLDSKTRPTIPTSGALESVGDKKK